MGDDYDPIRGMRLTDETWNKLKDLKKKKKKRTWEEFINALLNKNGK